MPRAMRSNLALKLATVALGAATLAIAAGQLPAQAAYGPPPPPPNAPGGFRAVVTSVTIGPGGGVIGPVRIDGLLVALTIPPGTFTTPVQITLTAPRGLGIGSRGHPGYRPVGGVGVLVQVNGVPYTGNFAHRLTLDISGFSIGPRDRVGEWNGTIFQFIGANASWSHRGGLVRGIWGLRGLRAHWPGWWRRRPVRRAAERGSPDRWDHGGHPRQAPAGAGRPGQPVPGPSRVVTGRDRCARP